MTNKLFEPSNRLVERCSIEFEKFVAELHSAVASHSRISVPWAPYEQLVTPANIPAVMRGVRKAFEARAMFAMENPAWGSLPLGNECNALSQATGAMHVLGCYAFSLLLMD